MLKENLVEREEMRKMIEKYLDAFGAYDNDIGRCR
jgi:hypothetical protein